MILINLFEKLRKKGFRTDMYTDVPDLTLISAAGRLTKDGYIPYKFLAVDPHKIKPHQIFKPKRDKKDDDEIRELKPLTELYALGVLDVTEDIYKATTGYIHMYAGTDYMGGVQYYNGAIRVPGKVGMIENPANWMRVDGIGHFEDCHTEYQYVYELSNLLSRHLENSNSVKEELARF